MAFNFAREDFGLSLREDEQWGAHSYQVPQLPGKNFIEPTNDFLHVELVSRSLKKQTTNYQISFEEGLLDEH